MARHPLQRLASPSRTFSGLIHFLGLASFSASFTYLFMFPTPISTSHGGQFQYLTIIGLSLATITFTLGLLADIMLSPRLFALKNALAVCSTPLEVLVSTLYGGLTAIDKTLVVPPELELPLLPDIGFHAMPAIMLSLDLILLSPPWTIKSYNALTLSLALAFAYWGWVEYCFTKNGWYPYPIFDLLNTTQRVLLFSFSAVLMTGSTMALKWVYGKLNGIEKMKGNAIHPTKID